MSCFGGPYRLLMMTYQQSQLSQDRSRPLPALWWCVLSERGVVQATQVCMACDWQHRTHSPQSFSPLHSPSNRQADTPTPAPAPRSSQCCVLNRLQLCAVAGGQDAAQVGGLHEPHITCDRRKGG